MIETYEAAHLEEIKQAGPLMVYDLAVVVNAAFQQNVEPTKTGHIPKRIENKLRPQLKGSSRYTYDGDDLYIDMLFMVLTQMGVLHLSSPTFPDIKLRMEAGPMLPSWANMDLTRQTANLLRVWLETSIIVDTLGAEYNGWSISWPSSSHYYLRDISGGRRALLEQLQTCSPNTWYDVNSLLEQLWRDQPLALYKLTRGMQISAAQKAKENHDGWMKTDGQIYVGMLMSSLAELGIISRGYQPANTSDQDDDPPPRNPDAFLLHEEGAALIPDLLNKKIPSFSTPAEPQRSLIVQPNFELFLLQSDLPTLYHLLPFSQINQAGTTSRLTLTKTSILRGISAGIKIEQIIQILTDQSAKDVPQNVVYTLQDWARQYKEVHISSILLLDTPNEKAASQLCSSARMQSFGVRQLAPTLLAVNGDTKLQELRSTLEKEGVSVHLSGNFTSPL